MTLPKANCYTRFPSAQRAACFVLSACVGTLMPAVKAVSSPSDFDVLMRMVARYTPSPTSSVAISEDQLKLVLGHIQFFELHDTFFVEVWVSDVGALNSGVTGFFTDLMFENSILRADALFHTPGPFSFLAQGNINNGAGIVENFGGNDATLAGQGLEPLWTRVGYVQLFALASGTTTVESSLGIGGIGVFGRLPPSPNLVSFDSVMLTVPDASVVLFIGIGVAIQGRFRRRGVMSGGSVRRVGC